MMMDAPVKPEQELRTVWMVVWLITYCAVLVAALSPWAAETVFGARIEGLIPTIIMIASFTAVMAPILVWIPAYYRSLEYRIEADAIRGKRGVFWKRIVTVPFGKITNVDITQGPLQRAFDIGNLHVQTAGSSGSQGGAAELVVYGIRDLEGLKRTIMERIASAAPAGEPGHGTRRTEAEALEAILTELSAIRQRIESRK
jgi:membrane protein YdbS with pleckstrin-like domain